MIKLSLIILQLTGMICTRPYDHISDVATGGSIDTGDANYFFDKCPDDTIYSYILKSCTNDCLNILSAPRTMF